MLNKFIITSFLSIVDVLLFNKNIRQHKEVSAGMYTE